MEHSTPPPRDAAWAMPPISPRLRFGSEETGRERAESGIISTAPPSSISTTPWSTADMPVRAGCLLKRSRFWILWHRRWCTLDRTVFRIFKDEQLDACTESVELHCILTASVERKHLCGADSHQLVRLRLEHRHDILLAANSSTDAEIWASAINVAASDSRRRGHALTALQTSTHSAQLAQAIEKASSAGIDHEVLEAKRRDLKKLLCAEEQSRQVEEQQRRQQLKNPEDEVIQQIDHGDLSEGYKEDWPHSDSKRSISSNSVSLCRTRTESNGTWQDRHNTDDHGTWRGRCNPE